jgi:hypothetical protein
VGKFDQQTPKVLETSSKNALATGFRHIRKGEPQVVQARTPLAPGEVKSKPGKDSGGEMGNGTRQYAERLDERKGKAVFGEFFYASVHGRILA